MGKIPRKKCSLCSRLAHNLTRHHSLPKTKRAKKSYGINGEERICSDCHKAVHYIFTNTNLRKLGKQGIRLDKIETYRKLFPKKVAFLEDYISAIQEFNIGGMRKPKEFFYMLEHGLANKLMDMSKQEKIEYTWRKLIRKKQQTKQKKEAKKQAGEKNE